jgi:uncharacterized RDD family membrane protein YckC
LERKSKEFALEYAGFWIRLGAGVVDLLVLGSFTAALGYFFPFIAVWIPAGLLLSVIYWLGFWIWRGQTPGKMAVGIKVIRTDSSPVKWRCAVRRCLGYFVSVITLFMGFIWVAFDAHKQGVHDKIADTYVVKLPVRQLVLTGPYARGHASYG